MPSLFHKKKPVSIDPQVSFSSVIITIHQLLGRINIDRFSYRMSVTLPSLVSFLLSSDL
jgi:hypothetical protein